MGVLYKLTESMLLLINNNYDLKFKMINGLVGMLYIFRGPVLWNHLPIECRIANGVKSFPRMINKLTLVRDMDFSNLFCRR